ncbi:uncharacterized protein BP01DRAFT_160450 [Aspergillus saccharolyticus JOP 1030-1]|uniref:Uncharacterized protein n=1 Tax=Aspergillus saccharolyticus JOP 1030-1 TaxID=1450539 RepID=A0A318Z5X9_9EURO|nr:hypothetical protein BP01DRAFT_160450 [Aspergillus saccharolyticus JOP 1030-1]PYH41854.1 hypothetical protein BP01DRAFT_160450 [Aspergillus saccharolyticus JOP 1030-1]
MSEKSSTVGRSPVAQSSWIVFPHHYQNLDGFYSCLLCRLIHLVLKTQIRRIPLNHTVTIICATIFSTHHARLNRLMQDRRLPHATTPTTIEDDYFGSYEVSLSLSASGPSYYARHSVPLNKYELNDSRKA